MSQAVVLPSSVPETLTGAVVKTLSPEVQKWLEKCPDPSAFCKAISQGYWLASPVICGECGKEMPRFETRPNEINPASDGQDMCCKDCWDAMRQGKSAFGRLRHAPKWPAEFVLPKPLRKGVIIDKSSGKRVGYATYYNPETHMGHVDLDAYPACGEFGSLDPGHKVVMEPLDSSTAASDNFKTALRESGIRL